MKLSDWKTLESYGNVPATKPHIGDIVDTGDDSSVNELMEEEKNDTEVELEGQDINIPTII